MTSKAPVRHEDSITTEWETIGPALALEYLETMGLSNRKVVQSDIDHLASKLRAGKWVRTHQSIAFDVNGRLVDGQNRLWAVVETGIAIDVLVSRGLLPEDVVAIDSGRARGYADVAHYEGWNSDPMTGALAKLLVMGPGMARTRRPHDVVHGWYLFYKEQIDFAIGLRNANRPSVGKSITVAMTAAIARSYNVLGAEKLSRFAEILKSGQLSVEADRAAFVLREAWLQDRLGKSQTDHYLKTEGALRAFDQRRPIRSLQRPEGELFKIRPLPPALRYEGMSTVKSPRTSAKARKLILVKG